MMQTIVLILCLLALHSDVDNESDLDDFSQEDALLCVYNGADDVHATRYYFRKRKHGDVVMGL
jgi:hypothetical protein